MSLISMIYGSISGIISVKNNASRIFRMKRNKDLKKNETTFFPTLWKRSENLFFSVLLKFSLRFQRVA